MGGLSRIPEGFSRGFLGTLAPGHQVFPKVPKHPGAVVPGGSLIPDP